MKYKGFIYLITNKVNGKRYVGQTLCKGGIDARWNGHKRELNRNKHNNKHLQGAWDKYGEDNFEFEVLHELNFSNKTILQQALNDLEKMYIKIWNLLDNEYGYNISDGGSNGNAYAGKTEEEMKIIRKKISDNNPMRDPILKQKAIQNRKLSIAKNGFKGGNPKGGNCKGTRVKCIEIDMVFDSIRAANEYFSKPKDCRKIQQCLETGTWATAFKCHWQYVED